MKRVVLDNESTGTSFLYEKDMSIVKDVAKCECESLLSRSKLICCPLQKGIVYIIYNQKIIDEGYVFTKRSTHLHFKILMFNSF
jgi:hypothetical protein